MAETAKRFLDQTHLIAQNKAIAELQQQQQQQQQQHSVSLSSSIAASAAVATGVVSGTRDGNSPSEANSSLVAAIDTSSASADNTDALLSSSINAVQTVDFPYDAKLKALHEQVIFMFLTTEMCSLSSFCMITELCYVMFVCLFVCLFVAYR